MSILNLVRNIDEYEPGLYQILKEKWKVFQPQTNEELKEAVSLWFSKREKAIEQYGHISTWQTNKITSMSYLFSFACNFNENISNWDTSNVTSMNHMFHMCSKFNQPIGKWNVRNVTNMDNMFDTCDSFNQDLSRWDVRNIETIKCMFKKCKSFNQDLSQWKLQPKITFKHIFKDCPNMNIVNMPPLVQYALLKDGTNSWRPGWHAQKQNCRKKLVKDNKKFQQKLAAELQKLYKGRIIRWSTYNQ